jgi:hypothetical protein
MSATGSYAVPQRGRLIGLIGRRAEVVGMQNPECDARVHFADGSSDV